MKTIHDKHVIEWVQGVIKVASDREFSVCMHKHTVRITYVSTLDIETEYQNNTYP
jgi:hypothetical protein